MNEQNKCCTFNVNLKRKDSKKAGGQDIHEDFSTIKHHYLHKTGIQKNHYNVFVTKDHQLTTIYPKVETISPKPIHTSLCFNCTYLTETSNYRFLGISLKQNRAFYIMTEY